MEIKPQLILLLINMPSTHAIDERRALLNFTGFDYLLNRINNIGSNNYVFFSQLTELLFSEGQTEVLRFLNTLVDSGLVGLETREKLNGFIAQIKALEPFKWNSEFNQPIDNDKVDVIPASNRTAESFTQQNTKLIVPSIPGTKIFDFTVVTINAQGKEIDYSQRQACCLKEELRNGVVLDMIYIPEGEYWMGSAESEGKRYSEEKPQHLVTVKPFLISKYPVTQTQWREIATLVEVRQKLKLRPSRKGGKNHPVTQVSWFEAVEFCDRLSQKTGHKYRLPNESEWEYACRAGTSTPFHFGETINFQIANYDSRYPYRSEPKGIYLGKTTEVGSFGLANFFGLFDMHGLIWEWCLDNWHENYDRSPTNGDTWLDNNDNDARVMRGGSWRNEPFLCRSSSRQFNYADETLNNVGFRVVRSL
ncbi:MAG: SUMF1/EgtB/PvdO family nonheme iron enzyme [Cyanobacteria bacterium P01_A01_bin.84]